MKTKIYLRVAEGKRGYKVDGSAKPNFEPLSKSPAWGRSKEFLPTVSFAIVVDVPDELFRQAERTVAEINIALKEAKVSAEVLVPEIKALIKKQSNAKRK